MVELFMLRPLEAPRLLLPLLVRELQLHSAQQSES